MSFWTWLGFRYCRLMHPKIMRPIRGAYLCATCLRRWPCCWALDQETAREEGWEHASAVIEGGEA